jgi:hypothetical protein
MKTRFGAFLKNRKKVWETATIAISAGGWSAIGALRAVQRYLDLCGFAAVRESPVARGNDQGLV